MTIAEANNRINDEIRRYWNDHIHDLAVVSDAPGTRGFFAQLDDYRYDKLRYLTAYFDFPRYQGRRVLEIGCGVGTDLVRFARAGANVTGIDLSETAIELARKNFDQQKLEANLKVMDGLAMSFPADSFDVVIAHGVIPYVSEPERLISEIKRVLKPDGEAILMVYNRRSWLMPLSKIGGVSLEHADAPVLRTLDAGEFRSLLAPFSKVDLSFERFPVRSRLHKGWKGALFNGVFVRTFDVLPRSAVRNTGWHLLARVKK